LLRSGGRKEIGLAVSVGVCGKMVGYWKLTTKYPPLLGERTPKIIVSFFV